MYNATGKLVYKAERINIIDVTNFEHEVYFIRTEVNGEEVVKKILIQ